MRVAVFRAKDDSERTARHLAALGHEALIAPVLEIVQTGHRLPAGRYDAVVFTSQHGVAAITNDPALVPLRSQPCFCVGRRTAAEAQAIGFRDLRTAEADATRLASLLLATFSAPADLLFVAGRNRKPTAEALLKAAGHRVFVVEAYEARAILDWDQAVVAAFGERAVDAGLHYSRRSVELTLAAARKADVAGPLLAGRHHCLSADAAAPLREAGARQIIEAARPNEESLLASLAEGSSG